MSTKLDASTVYRVLMGGTALFNRVVFTMYMLFQVDLVGLTALQLVLVGTALEVTVMIFEIPTGVVADTISRRLSIIIGMTLTGIAFITQAVPSFLVILLGSCLWGIGWTFCSGAISAWIYDEVGDKQADDLFLQGSQLEQVMGIIGLLPSVALGLISPPIAIIAGGVGYLLLALFLAFTMPETNFKPLAREERNNWGQMLQTTRSSFSLIRKEPVFLIIIGVTLFTGLYSEPYDRLWPKHVLDLGLGDLPLPVWFGLISLVGQGLGLMAAGLARRIKANSRERVVGSLLWIKSGMVIMLALVAMGPSLWFVLIAMWGFDMLRAVSFPLHESWINQRITDSNIRATVISIDGQTDALGQLLGGPPLGYVGQRLGIRAALMAASAVLIPAAGLLGVERRRERNTQ